MQTVIVEMLGSQTHLGIEHRQLRLSGKIWFEQPGFQVHGKVGIEIDQLATVLLGYKVHHFRYCQFGDFYVQFMHREGVVRGYHGVELHAHFASRNIEILQPHLGRVKLMPLHRTVESEPHRQHLQNAGFAAGCPFYCQIIDRSILAAEMRVGKRNGEINGVGKRAVTHRKIAFNGKTVDRHTRHYRGATILFLFFRGGYYVIIRHRVVDSNKVETRL